MRPKASPAARPEPGPLLRDGRGTAFSLAGEGRAPVLVLIHGVGLDRAMWFGQVEDLARTRKVLTYDMLGHGQSPDPPGPRSMDHFVGQLMALLDHLGLDRVGLAGFSMGSLVARAFALAHPGRVEKLALLNTVFQRYPDQQGAVEERVARVEAQGPEAGVEEALERWLGPGFRAAHPEIEAYIRQRFRTDSPSGYLKAYRLFAQGDEALGKQPARIRPPTLILTGERDSGSTPAMSQALAGQTPGARCIVLPGLRHLALIEGRERVNRLLADFFGTESRTYPGR